MRSLRFIAEDERTAPVVRGLDDSSLAIRGSSTFLSIESDELARRAAIVVLRLERPGGDVKLADVEGADDGLVEEELIELAPPEETEDMARAEEVLDFVDAFVLPEAAWLEPAWAATR